MDGRAIRERARRERERERIGPIKNAKNDIYIYDRGWAVECEREIENGATANSVCVCGWCMCAMYDSGATKRNDSKPNSNTTSTTHIRIYV